MVTHMGDVLHGTWLPALKRLFLWGEADDAPPRRGRKAALPIHPFQSDPSRLRAIALAGASLDVTRAFFGWLELTLDVSVWHFDDPLRDESYGTVVSEALSGTVRLSPETLLFAEFQHAASRVVGNRFRGMLALRVDTWR